jgi:hypothetical protein
MNKKDTEAAADALIRWFKSQGISPLDAVPVVALTLAIQAVSNLVRDHPEGPTLSALNEIKQTLRDAGSAIGDTVYVKALDFLIEGLEDKKGKSNDRPGAA